VFFFAAKILPQMKKPVCFMRTDELFHFRDWSKKGRQSNHKVLNEWRIERIKLRPYKDSDQLLLQIQQRQI